MSYLVTITLVGGSTIKIPCATEEGAERRCNGEYLAEVAQDCCEEIEEASWIEIPE